MIKPLRSHRRFVPALAAVTLSLPTATLAQSAGSDESAFQPSPAQQLSTAPAPGAWATSATLGLQIKDGRTETRGYDVDFILAHSTRGRTLLRLDAEWERAEYRPAPGAGRITVDDTRFASLTAVRALKGRLGTTAVASWRRDVPAGLRHRVMGQAGLYLQLLSSDRVHLMVAPLVGAGRQDNAGPGASAGIVNVGGVQALTWHPTPTFAIQTQIIGHRDLDEADDYSLSFNASGTAMIARHLGLKLYYKYQAEGIHPADASARQHEVGGGLTITFPGG